MRRKMLSICLLLVGLLVGSASASQLNWVGDPQDPLGLFSLCDPTKWDIGLAPGPGDFVYVGSPPYQGPVVDCNADVAGLYGPAHNSDADQVMDFVSGEFTSDLWKIGMGGTGKAIVNISGDANVTISGQSDMGGVHGPGSGTGEINVSGNAFLKTRRSEDGLRLGSVEGTSMVLNISGNARVTSNNEDGWRLADDGSTIVNISENANISAAKIRTVDETDGYIEIHMSSGTLSVGSFLSMRDDGSGILDFSGGMIETGGLSFSGRACSSWAEINISGDTVFYAWEAVRLSYGACGPSTLNISGGLLSTDRVELASARTDAATGKAERTSESTLNMTGGLLEVMVDITVPYQDYATATINLDGGTITCREFKHAVVAGDLDENGVVGWEDLTVVVGDWLNDCGEGGGACGLGDLDKNGVVDMRDYVRFAARWGDRPQWQMDVCGGNMIIDGDVVDQIQEDIAAGHITVCDGTAGHSIVVDFDNLNPGKTTILVEPSP